MLSLIWFVPTLKRPLISQDNQEISLANAKFNESASNMQEIPFGSNYIPSATKVANPTTLPPDAVPTLDGTAIGVGGAIPSNFAVSSRFMPNGFRSISILAVGLSSFVCVVGTDLML